MCSGRLYSTLGSYLVPTLFLPQAGGFLPLLLLMGGGQPGAGAEWLVSMISPSISPFRWHPASPAAAGRGAAWGRG